jgi:hypothetical protein
VRQILGPKSRLLFKWKDVGDCLALALAEFSSVPVAVKVVPEAIYAVKGGFGELSSGGHRRFSASIPITVFEAA